MWDVVGNLRLAVVMQWQMQLLDVCITTAGFALGLKACRVVLTHA